MPYIKKENRTKVNKTKVANNAGELNYLLSKESINYISEYGEKYQHYNDILGILVYLQTGMDIEDFDCNGQQMKLLETMSKIIDNCEGYLRECDIIGAIEGVKLELYRRKIQGYEDLKISENGDIF